MKYRILTQEELKPLEKEFISFLVVLGISPQEWMALKKSDPLRVTKLVEDFSDVIFDKIIQKLLYLEIHDASGLKLFKCESDQIYLIGIESPKPFKSVDDMIHYMSIDVDAFQIFYTSKAYYPDRSMELFNMIQDGALVSNGSWYEKMMALKAVKI